MDIGHTSICVLPCRESPGPNLPAETAQYMISDATAEERLAPNGPLAEPPPPLPPVPPPPRAPCKGSWLLVPLLGDELPPTVVACARSGAFSLAGTDIERLIGFTIGIREI